MDRSLSRSLLGTNVVALTRTEQLGSVPLETDVLRVLLRCLPPVLFVLIDGSYCVRLHINISFILFLISRVACKRLFPP